MPRAYLGDEQGVARAVLSQEDVRMARSVLRVQQALKKGYRQAGRVHLSALNIDPSQADFDFRMTAPSSIFEMAQIEVMSARADLAGRMQPFVSVYWILSSLFKLSDEEIETIFGQKISDSRRDGRIQAILQNGGADAAQPEGGGSEGFGGQQGGFGGQSADFGSAPASGEEEPSFEEKEKAAADIYKAKSYSDYLTNRRSHKRKDPRPLTEKVFMEGNRDVEKRLGDRIAKMEASTTAKDRLMVAHINEVRGLLKDLAAAARRGAYREPSRPITR
jgi:hypothetical protein